MDAQPVAIVRALAIAIAAGSLAPFSATAQPSAPNTSSVPRTPDGHPDLQGVWDFGSVTALERPAALAGKEFLTDEDVADLEAQAAAGLVERFRRLDADTLLYEFTMDDPTAWTMPWRVQMTMTRSDGALRRDRPHR